MNKKITSLLLTGVITLSVINLNFALSPREIIRENQNYQICVNENIVISDMTKAEIIQALKSYDFNEDEIQELFRRNDKNILNQKINLFHEKQYRNYSSSFPSNPYMGQIHTSYFSISNIELGLPGLVAGVLKEPLAASKSTVSKALIKKFGLPAIAWAALGAGTIVSYINSECGYSGFNIEIDYRYGEDNHMSVSWTPGPIRIASYK